MTLIIPLALLFVFCLFCKIAVSCMTKCVSGTAMKMKTRWLEAVDLIYSCICHCCLATVLPDSLRPYRLQHVRLPCLSPSPGDCSNAYLLSRWSHPTILSSVIPFSSCLQSFPASVLCCAVLSHSVVTDSLRPHGLQHARLLCPWGFSRQEHWSGLPCLPPGDLPNSGIKPRSLVLQVDSLTSESPGKPSQHQGLFYWVCSSYQVSRVLELQLQPHSFQ